ncbi:MAG: signal peptide peptidase SppA [Bacteroidales bacterium]|nr:signal peptide peptidase SppA [Bacteroidales bacterium]
MKEFWKMLLAAALGCFVAGLLTLFFFISFLGNLFTFESGTPGLKPGSVLRIDMSQIVFSEKKATADLQSFLQGQAMPSVTLWDAVKTIKKAESDPRISIIFLKPDGLSADIAQLEELRKALLEFRSSGKAVVSFCEFPTLGSYYLASVSDRVFLSANKGAGPQINGVGTQMFFLGDLLNKLDVNVQLIRHGKFKSAGEMFIKSEPSAENLLQTKEMIGSIWKSIADDIAAARGIDAGSFTELVENLKLNSCESMVEYNLADELLTREGLKEKLATLSGAPSYDKVNYISLTDYVRLRSKAVESNKKQIAILVASGEIVEGVDDANIAGDTYASAIAALRKDDRVKAVVLRVASPGGSVLASDKIKTELDLLAQEKPLIASYGSYAASGGYWISNNCNHIFTDKTTLTGSIGVFSMIPDISRTFKNKLHVNVVTVGSSKHNGGVFAPLDAQEREAVQEQIEDIYQAFVNTVAEGRGMEPSAVDEIAQGRVWTGSDAIGLGLVDEVGSLMEAVRYAAVEAGDSDLTAWNISTYPTVETTFIDELVDSMGSEFGSSDVFADTPLHQLEYTLKRWYKASSQERYFARMPYEIIVR